MTPILCLWYVLVVYLTICIVQSSIVQFHFACAYDIGHNCWPVQQRLVVQRQYHPSIQR